MKRSEIEHQLGTFLDRCKKDWLVFAQDALDANLDKEQQDILQAIQHNKKVSIVSGTGRGKDYVAAVAAMCFHYLTPRFDNAGKLVANSKCILSAPTDRQCLNVMMPEI